MTTSSPGSILASIALISSAVISVAGTGRARKLVVGEAVAEAIDGAGGDGFTYKVKADPRRALPDIELYELEPDFPFTGGAGPDPAGLDLEEDGPPAAVAARLDDVVNWLPARLAGLLLTLAAGVMPRARAISRCVSPSTRCSSSTRA